MPVLFQTISDDHFNIEQDFVVKESQGVNTIIGIFILCLVVGLLSTIGIRWTILIPIASVAITAIAYIKNGVTNPTVILINKNGFYYYGQFITNWNNFIDIKFIDDMPRAEIYTKGIQDRFGMMIRYYKDGEDGYYGRKISFTDTQDKSEEEIIAAIKFYHSHYMQPAS